LPLNLNWLDPRSWFLSKRDDYGTLGLPEISDEYDGEKIKTLVPMPVILPFFDLWQTADENPAMRRAYRQMARSPIVKAALYQKIFNAATLKFQSHAWKIGDASPDRRDSEIAEAVKWQFTEGMEGGIPEMAWNVLIHSLIDGLSVNEEIWDVEDSGLYKGKECIRRLKPKDVDQDLYLWVDSYRNVTAVQGLRYNGGEMWSPDSFVIHQNCPLFGNPGGMSDLRACYDDKTEVLTKAGWKFFADLTDDDEIASLDRSRGGDGRLVYSKPTERMQHHYQGEMFRQKSRHIDLCVTPDHRMWVAKRNGSSERGPFEFVEASRLMDGSYPRIIHYKRNAEWEGKEVKEFVLPAIEWKQQIANKQGTYGEQVRRREAKALPMDDWLRFLGIYLAEGSCYRDKKRNKQCSVCLHQNEGETLEEMKKLVQRLGFEYCVWNKKGKKGRTIAISNLQLWDYIRHLGKSYTKHVPQEYKNLSRRQLNILLEWMMKGDGRHEGTHYCTVSDRLANDVSEIILKCGFAPTTFREKTYKGGIWIISANTKGIDATEVNRIGDKRSWEMYDGIVYCVTVPQGVIYVRRNGKSCWCGNCYTPWWTLDTAEKLRAMGAEKRAFPVVSAEYRRTDTQKNVQSILSSLRYSNWIAVPEGVKVQVHDMAGQASEYFARLRQDKVEEIFLGIQFAFLHSISSGGSGQRGSAQVSQHVSSLAVWWLAQQLMKVMNRKGGLVQKFVDRNYRNVRGYPRCSLTMVDLDAMKKQADIAMEWWNMGWRFKKSWVEETFNFPFAHDETDALPTILELHQSMPGGVGPSAPRAQGDHGKKEGEKSKGAA
jgi:hypothetical protein